MLGSRLKAALALAGLTLVIPAVAVAATADSPDFANDIAAAVAPPSTSFTGWLDETIDTDDVFKIRIEAGQNLFVRMTPLNGASDFDLYLFPPGTASVTGTQNAVKYAETPGTSAERIDFRNAPATGDYYLDAWAFAGSGTYRIEYGFPTVTPSVLTTAPTSVRWGGTARITGVMRQSGETPVANQPVALYGKGYRQPTFVKVGETTTTAGGDFAFSVKPTSGTRYRARFLGSPAYLPADAPDVTITPYAYLTGPTAPSTAKVGAVFTSAGYLKPRHTAGSKSVKLSCYRLESGAWKVRKTVYATCSNYSSYSKYTARYSLPYRGKWKIVAVVGADALHLTTYSSPRYLTVQ